MAQNLLLGGGERIFYLSELLYFSEQIDFTSPLSLEFLVARIQLLLIFFDRILLSPEHIMISSTEEQARFKEAFFRHPIVQAEIHDERLITSMWSVCNDIQEHIEASKRYVSHVTTVPKSPVSLERIVNQISSYRRNQHKQSTDAGKVAKTLGWAYADSTEMLRYEDGKIVIPFSHEALILGRGRGAFSSRLSVNAAKLAYFRVTSSGNGGVFRALVPKFETTNGQGAVLGTDLVPPACFTQASIKVLLQALGVNSIPSGIACSLSWREAMRKVVNSTDHRELKSAVFRALGELAGHENISTEAEFKDAMRHVKFVNLLDMGAEAESVFKPMKFLQRLGHLRTKQTTERFYSVPLGAIRRINEIASTSAPK